MLQVSEIDRQLEAAIERPSCATDLDSKIVSTVRDAAKITLKPDNDALEFYERVKMAKHRKKSLRPTSVPSEEDVDEEGKRALTFQVRPFFL